MPSLRKIYYGTLFFFSGVAGLGYEILWTRMLSVGLGHEIVSVLAVVSAFFSGLALGAWCLDRPVSRSAAPARWVAVFELAIGLWAVGLCYLLPVVNPLISDLIGVTPSPLRHWTISFLYPLLVLLPATFAMGGTLPAMDRVFEGLGDEKGAVAGLYSINTFGAVTGTLLVTFWLLPAMGMNRSAFILAAINILSAAGLLILSRGDRRAAAPEALPPTVAPRRLTLYSILFITGLAGIGFEVLIIRALSQILENTIFSFASMLMVFLFGTAAGAAVYQSAHKERSASTNTLSLLLLCTAAFCLMSIYALRSVGPVFAGLQQFYGNGFLGAVLAEITIALLFFLLPTLSMGATFSHLARTLRTRTGGVGRALCLNTLGGALAPLLFGVLLLPRIGLQYALLTIPAAYLLCFPRRRRFYLATSGLLAILVVLVSVNSTPHPFIALETGDTIVSHQEGVMASVSVLEDAREGRHLKVNNHFQMGGTASVFSDKRQAYLPLLLHPGPEAALFLGVGTGATLAAAADFPGLAGAGVELIPEVVAAMDHFEKATGGFTDKPQLQVINADARRFVTATDTRYDVVVADLFHPARDGAGSLYTTSHFKAIRSLLTENGLFCQWLPLYQIDLETFKVIARTFLDVFPEGQAFLAHYSIDQPIIGLVGGNQPLRFPERWYRKRLSEKHLRRQMAGFGYDSVYSLLGTFMAGGDRLRQYVGEGPLNTDAHPVVLFKAPLFVYGEPAPAQQRLLALLDAFSTPDPEAILAEVVTEEDYLARPRLSAYWTARDSFLKLGTTIDRTKDVTQLHATVSQPLLGVVRKSVDFSAAYFPLISIAYELYPHDRDASHQLLEDLERANPMRPEAAVLKRRLFVKEG